MADAESVAIGHTIAPNRNNGVILNSEEVIPPDKAGNCLATLWG